MEIRLGCGHLSDEEFVQAFEDCRVGGNNFHHADHVRLAWIYVRRHGATGAETMLLEGIRRMAMHAGAPRKFMHTTTVAWARLIATAQPKGNETLNFADWIRTHPEFLNRDLLANYYSAGRLESVEARSGWVEPDLAPLSQLR